MTTASIPSWPVFEPDTADTTQELTDSAVLTRADDDPAVTVVVPITAPASSRGVLTSDQLDVLTSSGETLRNQLDAVDGNSAALAVDPAIPAAIRVLGSAAPASATEWLDDLMAPSERPGSRCSSATRTSRPRSARAKRSCSPRRAWLPTSQGPVMSTTRSRRRRIRARSEPDTERGPRRHDAGRAARHRRRHR